MDNEPILKTATTGQLLVERGACTAQVVEKAEKAAKAAGSRLCSQLLAMGACDERVLASVLAEKHGVPGIDLSRTIIPLEVLSRVPRQVAEADLILPLSEEGGRLHLAMTSPAAGARVVDEVRFVTGLEVSTYVAVLGSLRRAIAAAYDALASGAATWRGGAASAGLASMALVLPDERAEELQTAEDLKLSPEGDQPVEGEIEIAIEGPDAEVTAELAADVPPGEAWADAAPRRRKGSPPRGPHEEAASPHRSVSPPRGPQEEAASPHRSVSPPRGPHEEAASPHRSVSPPRGPHEEAASPPPSSKRVLVVDDEPEIRKLVGRALEAKGFAVDVAADGEEALTKISATLPDLVMLDAMLPRMHGFDVCRRVRSDPRTRRVPVIIMTAVYRGWRFAQDAQEIYGAQDYIEKPFHIEDLVRRAGAVLESNAAAGKQRVASTEQPLRRGKELLLAGQLDQAVATFEEIIGADPFSADAHYQLARALRARGEHFRAMTAFERAVELRDHFFVALRSLAALYVEKGFRRKASGTLERALAAAPDEPTREAIKKDLLRLL